jgi:alpha-beta hydrolase superfamily lysophospholipase
VKRWTKILLALLAVAGGLLFATTPAALSYSPVVSSHVSLQALLEDTNPEIIPGTGKRIVWADAEQATEWSVVALHGFSASRQETAPLAELVAARLGANLFETRFSGHGLAHNALVDVTAEEWLDDVAAALAVGELIGKKTALIAVSNGAALALSMLDHPGMQNVDAIILLSPNFGPADPKAMWITGPGGALLLRLIAGETRRWEAHNDLQARYWTTSYPTRTLIEVMRVVDRAIEKINTTVAPRVQIFFSPDDKVISVPALQKAYAAIQSPQKEIIEVLEVGAPSAHIIAGDIISPDNTLAMADQISDFILRQVP